MLIADIIADIMERYLDINLIGISEINQQKYLENVDKDFPGLIKMETCIERFLSKFIRVDNYPRQSILIDSDSDDSDDSDDYD